MKKVVVRPERCTGCMQCMTACALAHSRSRTLFGAMHETPRPRPRVHVGAGRFGEGFPNRCRHCDPAPCMIACLPGAISRDPETASVIIHPGRCINCASCAMACPFGVIRYHQDLSALPGQVTAIKCDNCIDRQRRKEIPACAIACKTGALVFMTPDDAMQLKTRAVAAAMSSDAAQSVLPPGAAVLYEYRRAVSCLNRFQEDAE